MAALIKEIKRCIEEKLDMGFRKFVIFPFGDVGMQAKAILRDAYGIEAEYIFHSRLWKYNPAIKPLEFLDTISRDGLCALLTTTDFDIYAECKNALQKYFADEAIAELSSMVNFKWRTKIGKYSYGPLCKNHRYIESIGAFCSFAPGAEVAFNHPTEYITTHEIIYAGIYAGAALEKINPDYFKRYSLLDGVQSYEDKIKPLKRIKIGNDVWLGQNVIITNYANIGNGVIAGAGSIITKDVPDYAVVVGAPARIIGFRYSPEEIESLNKIAWWDWTDDEIRERYDDFYLPISEFIRKYLK